MRVFELESEGARARKQAARLRCVNRNSLRRAARLWHVYSRPTAAETAAAAAKVRALVCLRLEGANVVSGGVWHLRKGDEHAHPQNQTRARASKRQQGAQQSLDDFFVVVGRAEATMRVPRARVDARARAYKCQYSRRRRSCPRHCSSPLT